MYLERNVINDNTSAPSTEQERYVHTNRLSHTVCTDIYLKFIYKMLDRSDICIAVKLHFYLVGFIWFLPRLKNLYLNHHVLSFISTTILLLTLLSRMTNTRRLVHTPSKLYLEFMYTSTNDSIPNYEIRDTQTTTSNTKTSLHLIWRWTIAMSTFLNTFICSLTRSYTPEECLMMRDCLTVQRYAKRLRVCGWYIGRSLRVWD